MSETRKFTDAELNEIIEFREFEAELNDYLENFEKYMAQSWEERYAERPSLINHYRQLFMEENLTPVKTNRYVWHVSSTKYRESILKRGLMKPEGHLIWANNQDENLFRFWPIALDSYDYFFSLENTPGELEYAYGLLQDYDFWCIDTRKLPHHKWFLDPILAKEDCWTPTYDRMKEYVCTTKNIPVQALSLYEYGKVEDEFHYSVKNGVATAILETNGIASLNLVKVA